MQVKPRVMAWGSWALVWGRSMGWTEAFCFGTENWKGGCADILPSLYHSQLGGGAQDHPASSSAGEAAFPGVSASRP